MNTWPVQDAKARFSELPDTCVSEGPQVVTSTPPLCKTCKAEEGPYFLRAASSFALSPAICC